MLISGHNNAWSPFNSHHLADAQGSVSSDYSFPQTTISAFSHPPYPPCRLEWTWLPRHSRTSTDTGTGTSQYSYRYQFSTLGRDSVTGKRETKCERESRFGRRVYGSQSVLVSLLSARTSARVSVSGSGRELARPPLHPTSPFLIGTYSV